MHVWTSTRASKHRHHPIPAQKLDPKVMEGIFASAARFQEDLGDENLTTEHLVLAMSQDQRFGEILSVAEGLDTDGVKKAIKKSRVLYNRWGARRRWPGGPCSQAAPHPQQWQLQARRGAGPGMRGRACSRA
jgi:hypothetical protein